MGGQKFPIFDGEFHLKIQFLTRHLNLIYIAFSQIDSKMRQIGIIVYKKSVTIDRDLFITRK